MVKNNIKNTEKIDKLKYFKKEHIKIRQNKIICKIKVL